MNALLNLRQLPLLGLLLLVLACDDGFDELNTNEVDPTLIDPIFQLNNAIVESSFPNTTLVYDLGIVQQITTPNSGVLTGANFNQDNRNVTEQTWQNYYRNVIKETRDILSDEDALAGRVNLRQMTRIVQAHAFMILTDSYGHIPYFEAGLGVSEDIQYPEYNDQAVIYPDLINELREASAALSTAEPIEDIDVLFGGNISKWKQYGYSLLLRAGMRLSKVDPPQAQRIVQEAVEGGVITQNDNNVAVLHNSDYVNGIGRILNATEANNYYLAAPFVNYLQENDDPRLAAIAVRYLGAASGPGQKLGPDGNGTNDPDVQIGMPVGNNDETAKQLAASLGLTSFYEFSQVDRERLAKQASPAFLVTAAQSLLLLSEAVERGWTSGSAEEFYTAGVRAHMEQMALYDPASAIPEEEIAAYLAANPFDAADALEQINTQYWVASFLNGPEAFANFRRSGFPDLAPNPFPNQDISTDFIRRITYPASEIAVNTENVNEAIASMGPDRLDTRVWWDVEQ